MKALRIRTKLTTWYSLILALSLCTFGAVAYFAMSGSIRATVDEDLRARLDGVRDIIDEDAPKGPDALQDEIKEFADGLGIDGRVRVATADGTVIFAFEHAKRALGLVYRGLSNAGRDPQVSRSGS